MIYNKNKAVITGMGVCAPNGVGLDSFQANTLLGISGCDWIQSFPIPDSNSVGKVAGIIKNFYPESLFSYPNYDLDYIFSTEYKDRQQLIAEFCINEAINNSGIFKSIKKEQRKVDLILASAIGPMISMEYAFLYKNIHKKNLKESKFSAFSFRTLTRTLSEKFDFFHNDVTIPTGCVGGCDAILYALNLIRLGKTNCVIAGAVESPITPLVITTFGRIKATSTRKCLPKEASRPFDIDRDGFVLGEGGGVFVIESEKSALERGAEILAEIKGAASVNNCYHMTDIEEDGKHIRKSCDLALKDANLTHDEIDYINSHGSSTKQNDIAESNAFNDLFKEKIKDIPVASLKSQIGHALSAANAIEMVSVVQTLNTQKIPPTINLTKQDPNCQLKIVDKMLVKSDLKNVLKTSSGFSGIHTAIIIGKNETLI